LLAVLGVLLLGGLGVWGLSILFPGRIASSMDCNNVLRGGGMLAIVAAGLASRQLKLKDVVRNTLIWATIVSVLVVGVSFRDRLTQGLTQIRSKLVPGYAVSVAPHEMVLSQDADGAFYVVGRVNGQSVTFLIDTGASDIVLSPADAQRLGVDLSSLHFDDPYETANGEGRGARYAADSLEVGSIKLSKVAMSINQQPMKTSLLGMAFFKKLDSFAFEGSQLHLKWRDHP
jgi:aspartyl protease family protein